MINPYENAPRMIPWTGGAVLCDINMARLSVRLVRGEAEISLRTLNRGHDRGNQPGFSAMDGLNRITMVDMVSNKYPFYHYASLLCVHPRNVTSILHVATCT
jgi:hypothetical protein